MAIVEPKGPALGPVRKNLRKPSVFVGFSIRRFFRGCSAVSPRMDGEAGGKDVSGPVEDVLNENPSHVALGKTLLGAFWNKSYNMHATNKLIQYWERL